MCSWLFKLGTSHWNWCCIEMGFSLRIFWVCPRKVRHTAMRLLFGEHEIRVCLIPQYNCLPIPKNLWNETNTVHDSHWVFPQFFLLTVKSFCLNLDSFFFNYSCTVSISQQITFTFQVSINICQTKWTVWRNKIQCRSSLPVRMRLSWMFPRETDSLHDRWVSVPWGAKKWGKQAWQMLECT